MASSIRAIQLAIAVANVLIFALAFTSIWPFPSGDFKINLPDSDDVEWSYVDGVVQVAAPFSIDNGGFYDVNDLVISYEVTNYTDDSVYSGTVNIGSVPAGQVTRGSIDFTLPLLELYNSGVTWMVFNDDFLNFAVDVSCEYTLGLVSFYAEYRASIPWDALIEEVEVDSVSVDGTELQIGYHVTTSSLLQGQSATIRAYLYNGSTVLAQDAQTVALGRTDSGVFAFDLLLPAVPDRVEVFVQIADFSVTESYPLDPGELL